MQFFYCAKRDKKAVELVGICKSASLRSDPQIFLFAKERFHMLSAEIIEKIEQYYANRKMLWEMFVQDFANFRQFYDEMKHKGYFGIHDNEKPLIFLHNQPIVEIKQKSKKTMLQRKLN